MSFCKINLSYFFENEILKKLNYDDNIVEINFYEYDDDDITKRNFYERIIKKINEYNIIKKNKVYLSENLCKTMYILMSYNKNDEKTFLQYLHCKCFEINKKINYSPITLNFDDRYFIYNQQTLIGYILDDLRNKYYINYKLKYNGKNFEDYKYEILYDFLEIKENKSLITNSIYNIEFEK